MNQPTLPTGWSKWQLEEILGEGSYGTVYRAVCVSGDERQYCAIKIIRIPGSETEKNNLLLEMGSAENVHKYYEDLAKQCLREINALNDLKGSPNIVSVEDSAMEKIEGDLGWSVFIRMELLTSFPEYRIRHALTEEDVITLGLDLCSALSECEKKGIIHRDIKPSNIFISGQGHYKLGDFGVARTQDQTGSVYSAKGTYSYMAPEVFNMAPYDKRADIYSLGLVLYKLLNKNRDPFVSLEKPIINSKEREDALAKRLGGQKLPVPSDASPMLAKVILKACDPNPKNRYTNAARFYQALQEVRESIKAKASKRKAVIPMILCLGVLSAAIIGFIVISKPDTAIQSDDIQNNISGQETESITLAVDKTDYWYTPHAEMTPEMEEANQALQSMAGDLLDCLHNDNIDACKKTLPPDVDGDFYDTFEPLCQIGQGPNRFLAHILCQYRDVFLAEVDFYHEGYDEFDIVDSVGTEYSSFLLYLQNTETGWQFVKPVYYYPLMEALEGLDYQQYKAAYYDPYRNSCKFDVPWFFLDQNLVHDGVKEAYCIYAYENEDGSVELAICFSNGHDEDIIIAPYTVLLWDDMVGPILTKETSEKHLLASKTREINMLHVDASNIAHKGQWGKTECLFSWNDIDETASSSENDKSN